MPQYIRAFIPGGAFFFAIVMLDQKRRLHRLVAVEIDPTDWAAGVNVRELDFD
ncbi:MAG: hypothetical protein ISP90_01805 [Nevskia sp.]|nr:hypothetical protein [Nevskia sp.]